MLKNAFFGFDSFSGFGDLDDSDVHPFYTDENFNTDYNKVNSRVERVVPLWTYNMSL